MSDWNLLHFGLVCGETLAAALWEALVLVHVHFAVGTLVVVGARVGAAAAARAGAGHGARAARGGGRLLVRNEALPVAVDLRPRERLARRSRTTSRADH